MLPYVISFIKVGALTVIRDGAYGLERRVQHLRVTLPEEPDYRQILSIITGEGFVVAPCEPLPTVTQYPRQEK